jgi:hypothetical protein
MVYSAITAGKKRATMASNLLGGIPGEAASVPGLVEIGDGRILSGGQKVGIADKTIINSNFDEEWRCLGCGHPTNRPCFKIRGSADAGNAAPQAVILGDQAVPVVMQVSGEKQCVKILQIEGGSLMELGNEFLRRLGNRRVPRGSAVLIFSASYLAEARIVAYAEELLAVRTIIQDKIGRATKVLPLPPVYLGGCEDPSLIRATYELIEWSLSYFEHVDSSLENSTRAARDILTDQGSGMKDEWEYKRLLLPDKTSPGGRREWKSGGGGDEDIYPNTA